MPSCLKNLIAMVYMVLLCSCGYSKSYQPVAALPIPKDTISFEVLGKIERGRIVIRDTIDLQDHICKIPKEVDLVFKGGVVRNGALEGTMTAVISSKACFDRVRIYGSWNVPVINSNMFRDLNYDNSLRDVVALSHASVKNRIVVEKGQYQVSAHKNGDICIPINSNTDIEIRGEIILTPNPYTNYYIINATGDNIKIHGNGTLVGDKHTHTGEKGEWGMGINLAQAHHIIISGLNIKDCWGDCIYVGTESTDVIIKNCNLDHGRRQGISVSSVDGLLVENCIITNVSGTDPQYGIDVEPNTNESIDNVKIVNVTIEDCEGGIQAWGRASGAKIGSIEIKKCSISRCSKMPIKIVKCSLAKVEKCITKGFPWKEDINFFDVDNVIKKGNKKK